MEEEIVRVIFVGARVLNSEIIQEGIKSFQVHVGPFQDFGGV